MNLFRDLFHNIFELSLLDEIEDVASIKHLKADKTLMEPGQAVRFIPILLKGSIKVSRKDELDNEVFLYYLNEGETCSITFTCCMQRKLSQVVAICEEDAELLIIPIDYMDKWMSQYSTWRSFVMNTSQAKFDELINAVDQIAFQKLDERLLTYLKDKSILLTTSVLNISHSQIAKDMNTSRVVVSRLLKKLEIDKVIKLGRNNIQLL